MYYPRFTKAIIHHFISKDKSISIRNRMFKHTARDDSILGLMRFVSRSDDFQVYGSLLPQRMTNQQMRDSYAYKTYLAYATGATSPKMKRKLKKHVSPLEQKTLITDEEEELEPAKKVAPAKVVRSKGIELLSDAALLEEAQLKKALRRNKRDTTIHQANGSSERANSESEVSDEQKGKLKDTSEGTGLKPRVPDVSTVDSFESKNKSWGDSGDEENEQRDEANEQSDDEDEQTLYGDVNISLKDVESTDKEKGDVEMTNTETGDAKHENVNQEGVGNQVKDDAQATPKTEEVVSMLDINVQHEVPRTSPLLTILVSVIPEHTIVNPSEIVTTPSSITISFLLSSLFPRLQQLTPIPTPTTTKATTSTTVVSESKTLTAFHQRITNLEKDVKELKTVDHSSALLSTIKSKVLKAVKEYLGTSMDDSLQKVLQKHSGDLVKEHYVPTEFVKRLRQQYVPKKSSKDIRKIKMEHARKQQDPKLTITSSDTSSLEEFDQKTTLFQTMTNSKSFNKSPKQRALYHALMESILEDEDAMDEGVADKKTNKDAEPSKKAKSTKASKGTLKSQPKSIVKSAQVEETVFEAGDTQELQNQGQDMGTTNDQPSVKVAPKHDWFKKPERPPTPDSDWNARKAINFRPPQTWISKIAQNNPKGKEYPFDLSKPLPLIMNQGRQIVPVDYFINNDLGYLRGGGSSKKYTTSTTKTMAAKYDIPGIEYVVPSLWSSVNVAYDRYVVWAVTNVKVIKWYDYGYLEEIKVRREDQQLYKFKEGDFPRLYLHDIEDMLLLLVQNKLSNLERYVIFNLGVALRMSDISNRTPYTTYINPQGIIYVDKYNRNRLMHSDELYKFSDGTLTSVRTVLHDIASNLRMDYLLKRRWSNLDRQRSRIMIKAIDKLLLERRLTRSLEKFVGGRDYEEDLRLLERTI
ncbi:hypothetical protein Tco_1408392 [Tanacetum coccineum]